MWGEGLKVTLPKQRIKVLKKLTNLREAAHVVVVLGSEGEQGQVSLPGFFRAILEFVSRIERLERMLDQAEKRIMAVGVLRDGGQSVQRLAVLGGARLLLEYQTVD